MKVFWYQAGLHFEPETAQERTALVLLVDNIRLASIASDSAGDCASVLVEKGPEIVGTDSHVHPSNSGATAEQFAGQ